LVGRFFGREIEGGPNPFARRLIDCSNVAQYSGMRAPSSGLPSRNFRMTMKKNPGCGQPGPWVDPDDSVPNQTAPTLKLEIVRGVVTSLPVID
jgi:hypothetical protein